MVKEKNENIVMQFWMSSAKLMWFRKSCSILDEQFEFKYMLACPICQKTLKNWMYNALGSSKLQLY